ncbi:hypothetical protein F5Y17DRAFT_62826 [Xylariaceae sp. FL0594]|nr:hypothetical protein F5Y17DRAFT_62826 [Xylariaceae sp. FL0594]
MASSNSNLNDEPPWYLRYKTPILFPSHDGFDLSMPRSSFDTLVRNTVSSESVPKDGCDGDGDVKVDEEESRTEHDKSEVVSSLSMTAATQEMTLDAPDTSSLSRGESEGDDTHTHPFIQALVSHNTDATETVSDPPNMMRTENGDMAYRSTKSPLVDLFSELEDVVSADRLKILLDNAWKEDSLSTLKIIFNARSIHLGKSSQITFYRCAGWLFENHPLTMIANLEWLSRPIIEKKKKEEEEAELDPDAVMVEAETEKPEKEDVDNAARFDAKHGTAHGYWKDLLNILVLAVEGQLKVLAKPREVLYVEQKEKKKKLTGKNYIVPEEAQLWRREVRDERHEKATSAFSTNNLYRGLHLQVSRLFAEQLKKDMDLLATGIKEQTKNISLCAKWAPSHDRFHDKHTFVVSSIAEMLYPMKVVSPDDDTMDRELYLRHARERYRKDVAALRAHLTLVERDLTAKTYEKIKYERVPSIAMRNYAKIFAEKDTARFEAYVNGVAQGRVCISGATLLPSQMVRDVMSRIPGALSGGRSNRAPALVAAKMAELEAKVADGQWKTLVQRIKDSGTLESSIAVCDTSGSMSGPRFADGTVPLHSSIGLSLILAEVTKPPFGGHFITFSERPTVQSIDLSASFTEKVRSLSAADWGYNTNFAAVFEDLILPMAVAKKLSQDDMVKRVFVFSDMQFDEADLPSYRTPLVDERREGFASSFDRIKKKYADAGYEMPELVFWNLAGGRAGYQGGYSSDEDDNSGGGDPTAPKPVTMDETGTALVSGYSQAMLKVFLDSGSFDDVPEEEGDEVKETVDEDGNVVVEVRAKRQKMDPLSTVMKAIGHKAYDPLRVVD